MKVIRQGPESGKRVECNNCGSLIEYMPVDTKEKDVRDFLGDVSIHTILECPVCKHQITLKIR